MPVSRKRKKAAYTPPATATTPNKRKPSPVWLAPLMLALFGLGVLWLVVFYITEGNMPVVDGLYADNWNLLIGFGFIIAGFALSTQWR